MSEHNIHSQFNACQHRERCRTIEQQRDELLEAIELCTNVMLHRGVHTDPQHPDRIALDAACSAIAKAKEGAQ